MVSNDGFASLMLGTYYVKKVYFTKLPLAHWMDTFFIIIGMLRNILSFGLVIPLTVGMRLMFGILIYGKISLLVDENNSLAVGANSFSRLMSSSGVTLPIVTWPKYGLLGSIGLRLLMIPGYGLNPDNTKYLIT